MIPKKLLSKEIETRFKKLSDWKLNTKKTELSKVIKVPSFLSGLAFIAKIAVHAEILGHHPDIALSYTSVKITLTTHDVKGLSKLDFELATRIDKLSPVR